MSQFGKRVTAASKAIVILSCCLLSTQLLLSRIIDKLAGCTLATTLFEPIFVFLWDEFNEFVLALCMNSRDAWLSRPSA